MKCAWHEFMKALVVPLEPMGGDRMRVQERRALAGAAVVSLTGRSRGIRPMALG
jgi:hypothetical protein